MTEVYVLIEREETKLHRILKYVMLALAIASVIINLLWMGFLAVSVLLFVIWFFMHRSYKEFEYSFFDGEFKFYSIKNKSRRKGLIKCDIEHVSAIAPAGDRSMYRYETDGSVKKLNYTSGKKDVPYYEMVVNDEDGTKLIMFEPDEKFLDAVCYKNGQKVIRKPVATETL